VVAAISGAAFLVSMLLIPFPESKPDLTAGVSASSQATTTTIPTILSK